MLAIEIKQSETGYHANQRSDGLFPLLLGWAVVPESLGTMETLEHFPFGDIAVEEIDGVPTVTGWTPLPVPEPGPEPEPETADTPVTWSVLAAAIREGVNEV